MNNIIHAWIQKISHVVGGGGGRGVPALTTFFLVEERGDPNTTKGGLSSAHQQNAIKWRFASGPMMAQH